MRWTRTFECRYGALIGQQLHRPTVELFSIFGDYIIIDHPPIPRTNRSISGLSLISPSHREPRKIISDRLCSARIRYWASPGGQRI